MATKMSTRNVVVPAGYLAYLGGDGYVWAAPRRGVKGTKKKIGSEKVERKPGHMYYVKDGSVFAMKNGSAFAMKR